MHWLELDRAWTRAQTLDHGDSSVVWGVEKGGQERLGEGLPPSKSQGSLLCWPHGGSSQRPQKSAAPQPRSESGTAPLLLQTQGREAATASHWDLLRSRPGLQACVKGFGGHS